VQPDFIVREALADGRLEAVMTDWSLPLGGLHLVTPPGGPRPARVEAFAHFLAQRFARSKPKTG
jgi:DNA-binding transcriptional LysR family regulator